MVKMVLPTCTNGATLGVFRVTRTRISLYLGLFLLSFMALSTEKYVTLQSKRSLLRVKAKLLYRGKVTDGKGQTPIAAGSKRPSRNLTGLPKTPYGPAQNTLRACPKYLTAIRKIDCFCGC